MAREGRNEDNQVQHRPQVLHRAFWTARQLDLVLPVPEQPITPPHGWTLAEERAWREHSMQIVMRERALAESRA